MVPMIRRVSAAMRQNRTSPFQGPADYIGKLAFAGGEIAASSLDAYTGV